MAFAVTQVGLTWLLVGVAAAVTAASMLCVTDAIHMLQLESYQLPGYFRWLRENRDRAYMLPLLPSGVALLALVVLELCGLGGLAILISAGLMLALAVVVFLKHKALPAKKPLKYTKRVWRLLAAHLLISAALSLTILLPYAWPLAFLMPFLSALTLVLSALVAAPIEKAISRWYFRDAQRLLRENPDLIRIGITGSYGKTSTKFILGTILSEKYNVLVTPSSFNTPMGVTRVIREQLKPEHEIFVAEMGARHKGDIQEMCELVAPTVGVLTSIGPQHLETFKDIQTVAATKNELMQALPAQDAKAYFAADSAWCEVLFAQYDKGFKTLAGLKDDASYHAKDLAVSPEGSSFTLVTPDGEIACTAPLLGRHNVQNIVLCAAVAHGLGLTLQQIAAGIARLTPVEHRLQLIHGAGGVTVIDDAFNANPAGAKAAMEVLAGFPGRRVVVTPGMVELGGEEESLNRAFGRQIARAADVALLIGARRTKPIFEGIVAEGFPQENIHVLNDLEQATAYLAREGRPGDVVLFENDLPDNY